MGDRLGIQVAVDILPGFAHCDRQTDWTTTPWLNLSLLTEQEGQVDVQTLWWGGSKKPQKIVSFSPTHMTKLPANRKQLLLPGYLRGTEFLHNISEHELFFSWMISFLSGLSLALNKEGCDWQDRHSSRANSGRATHLSQTRYTPLVEVNQAIKAWSF